ncbi:MAG: DoxX family protein [Gammaproteobacteria bacterium]|nr:DoxX family protein [Gammaproteobacteria bacterium]
MTWDALTGASNRIGEWIAPLALRIVLGWEYYESGREKFRGENWFGQVQDRFPWPFSVVPPDVSWFLATWTELIGAICLLIGLFTRFWAFSLIVLTIVAIAAEHWPVSYDNLSELLQGYVITDQGFGNYKLPLIFVVMLLPLLFTGAGKASMDHLLHQRLHR